MALGEERKTGEQLTLLSRQRQQLLEEVHGKEQRIRYLDYLVYRIQKTAVL